jgi:hypothetical protein
LGLDISFEAVPVIPLLSVILGTILPMIVAIIPLSCNAEITSPEPSGVQVITIHPLLINSRGFTESALQIDNVESWNGIEFKSISNPT